MAKREEAYGVSLTVDHLGPHLAVGLNRTDVPSAPVVYVPAEDHRFLAEISSDAERLDLGNKGLQARDNCRVERAKPFVKMLFGDRDALAFAAGAGGSNERGLGYNAAVLDGDDTAIDMVVRARMRGWMR